MSSPYPTFVLTALYLLIVYFGPKVMEKQEPFSLKNVIIVYNFFLVLLSAYMLYEVCLRKAFIILPLWKIIQVCITAPYQFMFGWMNDAIHCLSVMLSQIFTTIMLHSNSLLFTPHTWQKVVGMGTVFCRRGRKQFLGSQLASLLSTSFSFSFSYPKKMNSLGENILAFFLYSFALQHLEILSLIYGAPLWISQMMNFLFG